VAQELEDTVLRVFASEEPVRNLELSGPGAKPAGPWTWLASAYPVRTTPQQVRWVGVIVLDASDRKRSEEALRKTEKLAATGRLAASIAHEINNPLEAITNLLFLLRNFCQLEGPGAELRGDGRARGQRIAEITQQTLRFYRQSTLPTRANMGELLDSVLTLYRGRLNTLNIQVERDFDRRWTCSAFPESCGRCLPTWWATRLTPRSAGAGCWCARGARATGSSRSRRAFALPWPTPEPAWSRRCANASSKPSSPPRK
jgi:signal transduction histidine kinase